MIPTSFEGDGSLAKELTSGPKPRREVSDEEFRRAYYGDPSDEQSLKDASDNRSVLNSVTRRYVPPLSEHEASSCGMMAFWRALQYYRPEFRQKFTTSLHRFARWECNRELGKVRRRAAREAGTTTLPDNVEDSREGPNLDINHVQECLALIPPHHAKLIREHFFEGKTLTEVGAANGCSKETARLRLEEAVAALKPVCRGWVGRV